MTPEDSEALEEWHRNEEAAERYGAELDLQTIGLACALGLIPLGLIALIAASLFGEWGWAIFPLGFFAAKAALGWMPSRHRYDNDLPLETDAGTILRGSAKRRFLLKAGLVSGALFVVERLVAFYGAEIRAWTVPWPW